jgi:hypothetical protein
VPDPPARVSRLQITRRSEPPGVTTTVNELDRPVSDSLTFGAGTPFCLGVDLATARARGGP